jgi:hypothetical protein
MRMSTGRHNVQESGPVPSEGEPSNRFICTFLRDFYYCEVEPWVTPATAGSTAMYRHSSEV